MSSVQQVPASASSSSAAAAGVQPGSHKRKRDDAATVEAVAKRAKTNFETVLADKLGCVPIVLQNLVQAYLPPMPTKEALQELAKDLLKAGKTLENAVPNALLGRVDDAAPYIEGACFDFSALSIVFVDEVPAGDRYKRAADVMALFFQLLPGTTIEVGEQFKWKESKWVPYDENARPIVLRPGSMRTIMHDMLWAQVIVKEPKLESTLMVMQAETQDPTEPVESLEIGTRKLRTQYFEREFYPEFPLLGPLFSPRRPPRLPRPWNPDEPGIPDGPDAPNFRGPQMG